MGKTLSALMKGMLNLNDTGTTYEMAMFRPAELAMRSLSDSQRQEVEALVSRKDPRAQGKTASEIANDDKIDPPVRTAYTALENVRQWVSDTALASGADVARARPDGTIGIYHTYGEPSPVVKAAQSLQDAQDALVKTMEPGHRLTTEIASWDAQATSLAHDFGATIPEAEQAARKLNGQERVVIDETPRKLGGTAKVRSVSLDIQNQVRDLFGDEEGIGSATPYTEATPRGPAPPTEAGIMGRIQIALDQKDYAGLKEYTGIAKRRLDFANYKLREGRADDPALIKLSGQVDALHSYATKRIEYERRFLEHFKEGAKGKIDRTTGRRVGGMAYTKDLRSAFTRLPRRSSRLRQGRLGPPDRGLDRRCPRQVHREADRRGGSHAKRFGTMTKVLRDRGTPSDAIEKLRTDPTKMAQLIELETRYVSETPYDDPIVTPKEARRPVEERGGRGQPAAGRGPRGCIHTVGFFPRPARTRTRASTASTSPRRGKTRKSSRGFERQLAHVAQRHDVVAGIHQAAKEALQIRATIDFVDRQLTPHFTYQDEAWHARSTASSPTSSSTGTRPSRAPRTSPSRSCATTSTWSASTPTPPSASPCRRGRPAGSTCPRRSPTPCPRCSTAASSRWTGCGTRPPTSSGSRSSA